MFCVCHAVLCLFQPCEDSMRDTKKTNKKDLQKSAANFLALLYVGFSCTGKAANEKDKQLTNADQNRWKQCFRLPLSPVGRQKAIENSVYSDFDLPSW